MKLIKLALVSFLFMAYTANQNNKKRHQRPARELIFLPLLLYVCFHEPFLTTKVSPETDIISPIEFDSVL
jgi:hypothetical protein